MEDYSLCQKRVSTEVVWLVCLGGKRWTTIQHCPRVASIGKYSNFCFPIKFCVKFVFFLLVWQERTEPKCSHRSLTCQEASEPQLIFFSGEIQGSVKKRDVALTAIFSADSELNHSTQRVRWEPHQFHFFPVVMLFSFPAAAEVHTWTGEDLLHKWITCMKRCPSGVTWNFGFFISSTDIRMLVCLLNLQNVTDKKGMRWAPLAHNPFILLPFKNPSFPLFLTTKWQQCPFHGEWLSAVFVLIKTE